MSFKLPPGAIPLMTISLPDRSVTPEPEFKEIARSIARQIGGYVEEHGDIPEQLESWRDLGQKVTKWSKEVNRG